MLLLFLVVVWTVGAAVGTWHSRLTLREYRLELAVAMGEPSPDVVKVTMAQGHLRSERALFWTQAIALGIGVLALIYNRSGDAMSPEWVRVASRLGIVAAVELVFLVSVWTRRQRQRLLRLLDERGKGEDR